MRQLFGILVFGFASSMVATLLFDLSVFLMFGYESTLSQIIADWTGMGSSGEIWLLSFVGASSFMLGMLVTHFTQFRMVKREPIEETE